jgi:hypothetical protein
MNIIMVNGTIKKTNKRVISYEDIVIFAGYAPGSRPTVSYHYIGHQRGGGTLRAGEDVELVGNEEFTVSPTANA